MLIFKVSNHVQKLSKNSPAVKKQFFPCSLEDRHSKKAFADPLLEDKYRKTKGLVHKYPRRVLIELTLNCASYCRFCTRRRRVSDIEKGKLNERDIDEMMRYIHSKPDINEIIFSGGDPCTVPKLLVLALNKAMHLPQIKYIRVHTRVPVSQPNLMNNDLLRTFEKVSAVKPIYVSVHFEHPDELTAPTTSVIRALRKTGVILFSQSVFLKGINDSYSVLKKLFSLLVELGIRPYYIYHCDLVKGAEHFIVPIKKEITIMTKLRKNLSGIAFPFHVVDTPNGAGKIPIPLNFWKFSKTNFLDFKEKKIAMY